MASPKTQKIGRNSCDRIISANGWPFHTIPNYVYIYIYMHIYIYLYIESHESHSCYQSPLFHGLPWLAIPRWTRKRSLAVKDVRGSKPSRLGIHGGPLTTALLPWKKVSPEKNKVLRMPSHWHWYIYIYVYIHVYIYIYMCIYIYIVHTHTWRTKTLRIPRVNTEEPEVFGKNIRKPWFSIEDHATNIDFEPVASPYVTRT